MYITFCSFLFKKNKLILWSGTRLILFIVSVFIGFESSYAKDYRVNEAYRYSGKVKEITHAKEKPHLQSKTIGVLRPGDLVSVISQQGDFFAIRVKQKPIENIWVKKTSIQLYKRKDVEASKVKYSHTTSQKSAFQGSKKISEDNKNTYYIGLAHYRNIKQFSANQIGISTYYERKIKQYGLSLYADFLYNNLFKTYSVGPGLKYHFFKRNNYHLSSALYAGYERLYDSTRSFNAIISQVELIQINYKYMSMNFVFSPLQLRAMVSADQKIPVNFRHGISLGVSF